MSFRTVSRREALGVGAVGILALSLRTGRASRAVAADVPTDLIVRQESPFNAEPPLPKLIENWLTPVPAFFVRSHGNVPTLTANDLVLTVDGLVEKPVTLKVSELAAKFSEASTTATLTCAGNRRGEFSKVKKVGGVQWDAGAIGNAEWQGVRLADVLKAAGVKTEAKHVWFEGRDQVTEKNETFPFGGSIPIDKALVTTSTGAALLATKMNGQPLTPAHGFPLRSVVPGFIGARSVKWLHKITVADRPSPNHFVADVYKLVPEDNAELIAKTTPIYEFTLNSAICVPGSGATVTGERLAVKGFARRMARQAAASRRWKCRPMKERHGLPQRSRHLCGITAGSCGLPMCRSVTRQVGCWFERRIPAARFSRSSLRGTSKATSTMAGTAST